MADVQETKNALWRRDEQIRRWNLSESNKVSAEPRDLSKTSVKFQDGCVFLAACCSGDKKEVENLVKRGADINTANIDGLTALHQACIDDNLEMVEFLIKLGADIDACDNEGWTSLHATSSCGLVEIAQYLIEKNASIAAVNNDGELAFDLAESNEMEVLLVEEMEKQGIDAEAAREEEEQLMLRDANHWLNADYQEDTHPKTGATALHVAAAKGYMKVMSILLQAGADIDAKDFDSWTPLHAAAHWGQDEACKLLVENMCNMDIRNNAGQVALDVADSDVVPLLEELKKTQASLKEKHIEGSPHSDLSMEHKSQSKRRSSVTRMSVDQKQHIGSKSVEDERTKLEELRKVEEEKDDEKKSSETESVEEETSSGIENDEEDESSESETENKDEVNKKVIDSKPQPKDADIAVPTVQIETEDGVNEKNADKVETIEPEEASKAPPPKTTVLPPTQVPAVASQKKIDNFDTVNKPKDENNRPLSTTEIEMNAKNHGDSNHTTPDVSRPPRDILSENNKENNKDTVKNEKPEAVKKPQRDFASRHSDAKVEDRATSYKAIEKDKFTFKSPLKRSVSAPSKPLYKQTATSSIIMVSKQQQPAVSETNDVKLRVPDPSKWRAGLRKTGSSSAVPDPAGLDGVGDLDKLSRSASSSWIEKKEPCEEESTKPRRISSTSGVLPESTEATKNKFNDFYARYTSLLNNNKASTTSSTAATTSTTSSRPLSHPVSILSKSSGGTTSSIYQPYVPHSRRRQMEMTTEKGGSTTPDGVNSPTSPIGSTAGATIMGRRSFEPPKRDEEKEVERKARAKKARETRRSTQGVTKEDVVRAEETLKLANRGQQQDSSQGDRGKAPAHPQQDTSSDDKSDKENKPEDNSLRNNKRQTWSSSDLDLKKDDELSRSSLRRSRDNKDSIYSSDTSLSRSLRGQSGTLSSSSITSSLDTNHKMLSTSTGEPSSYTGSSYGSSRISGSYGGRDYSARREEETKDLNQPDVGSASPRYSKKEDKEEKEDPSQKSAAIRTRRKRESRRPTGKITLEDIQGTTSDDKTTPKEVSNTEEETTKNSRYGSSRYSEPASTYDPTSSTRYGGSSRTDRPSSYSGSTYSRSYTSSSIDSDKGGIDYKKLYEQEKTENERLRKDVDRLKQDLTETRVDLERTKVKTESKTTESREKRALERRISELEEEVKTIESLKADNQRLKEENGALIRVISKLSK